MESEFVDQLFDSRPGFVFVLTVTGVVTMVAAGAWAVVVFIFNSGPLLCSENGGEIVTRPAASAYLPELAVCVIAVLLLAAILQAAVGWRWGFALSAASAGSVLGFLTLAHYLSHANEPATHGCGALYSQTAIPAFVAPALLVVYVLVLLSCRWSLKQARLGSGVWPEYVQRSRMTTTAPSAGSSPKWRP